MARKKKMVLIEEEPRGKESDELEGLLDEREEQEQVEVEAWVDDFQKRFSDQPVKVLVEKYDESGDWAICKKYPLSSFEQESVRNDFGSGRYRATLYDTHGKYVKNGRAHFKFAEFARPIKEEVKPVNPLNDPVIAMMLQSMKSQNDMLLGITQSMITAQASKPASGGLGEVIEAWKAVNAMSPKSEKPFESFKEMLTMTKLFKEVTGGNEEAEKSGSLIGEIKEFLEVYPLIKDQLADFKNKNQAPAVPAQTIPREETPVTQDPLTVKIVALVPKFVEAAKANAPVDTWGSYLLEVFDVEILPILLPEMKKKYGVFIKDENDVYDAVLRYAESPADREIVFKQIPPLAKYREWVNNVIDFAVKKATTDDEGSSVIVEAVGGNGASAPQG